MSADPPSGGGGKKPAKPPQRTVIAPLPGARSQGSGSDPPPGPATDRGSGVWSSGGGAPAPASTPPAATPPASGAGQGQGQGQGRARPLPWQEGAPRQPPSGGAQGQGWPGGAPQSAPAPSPSQGGAAGQNAWMGSAGQDRFFPDISRPQPETPAAPQQKIPLEKALQTGVTGHAAGNNPLTAAAAGLLMLLGRLRSQVVDMEAMPLMAHVTREIEEFETRAQAGGADAQQALVAKYVLCGTADDIVQNLPGTDRDVWVQYAMEARFFNRRTSGVGIFQEIEKALMDPARCYDLLELMLICLQLGFEGQYRGAPGGDVDLQHLRRRIYETLRRVRARDDDDISPHWQGVAMATLHQRRRVPVWIICSLALAILCGGYIGLRVFLSGEAGRVADIMRGLHPRDTVVLARSTTLPDLPTDPEPYQPPAFDASDQLDRIRTALSEDIAADNLTVDMRGNFIAITANNLVLFDTGQAEVRSEFIPIAQRMASALEDETGDIRIVGHTDNVPMSGRGRFGNNQELSVARADSVAAVIGDALSDAGRIEVIGAGEDDPVADNATAEGRAANRRVEVLIRREEARPE